MKKLKLFLSLLMLMCLSVGNVWADETWTLSPSDFTTTSYDNNNGDHEIDGITINSYKVYQNSSGQIQFQAKNGTIYNKTAMPGSITKITAGSGLTIKVGTSSNDGCTTTVTSGNTISGDYTYFWIKKTKRKITQWI